MFYHIKCPSNPMCVYNYRLFRFHYYVKSFVFYEKQNVRAFNIILDVTMKEVAFESWPEIKGFIVKIAIIFLINLPDIDWIITSFIWEIGQRENCPYSYLMLVLLEDVHTMGNFGHTSDKIRACRESKFRLSSVVNLSFLSRHIPAQK